MMNRELSVVEQDAFALIENAVNISRAVADFDYKNLISALDSNLQLWVAIKTLASKNPNLSSDTKNMLGRLSNYVAKKTFEFGGMSEEDAKNTSVDFFINTNLQISEGLLECVTMSYAEDEAYSLVLSANAMKKAIESKNNEIINLSLDNNLKLWVAIKTVVKRQDEKMPKDAKESLLKLIEYVISKTFELSKEFTEKGMESLIKTNIQVSQGLLEGSEDANRADAVALLSSSIALSEAKEDNSLLEVALNDNLELWVKIKTFMQSNEQHLGCDIKTNLLKLADVVIAKTFDILKKYDEGKMNTLINANLQISEGLLERRQVFN
ncbi:MAG: flagellar biosynthesis regulatory protein FlaF [Alphaproteobacteria bacterium ADurb.Bin438]|nr:MAG: flagellar biosynthesis regulatory protein FlaF [Alphaproteobacteria bacterium ADurb.Bin438]